MLPERFGRFELVERMGHGGSGEVFLARAGNERVVLKRLLPHLRDDRALGERFLREAGVNARLVHPNVSRVLELGEVNGVFFFTQAFIEGRDCSKLGEVSVPLAARIVADAARGLDAAHQATDASGRALGLVHGDVSPKNLLVGADGVTRLIDFGLATLRSDEGSLGGTYEYMAPEQALDGVTDALGDQFSLGVVFWELLTGARLFAGDTDTLTLDQVVECRVTSARAVNPRVPAELDAVVLRMLQKVPAERFARCLEVATALDEWAARQPAVTRPPTRAPVSTPAPPRATPRPAPVVVTPEERGLLRQLSLLDDPFTLELLEERLVLPESSPPALDVAQSFADRGLLTATDGRLSLTPRLEAFDEATRELLDATDDDGRGAALGHQLRAVLALTGLEPLPLEALPPLWDGAMIEAARRAELAAPDPLSGWRLGELALLLPAEARGTVLDDALAAFARTTATPVGPGNDDGPFCDFAHALSPAQAATALDLVRAMQRAGWQDEARTAEAALVARLDLEGVEAPPLAPEDEAYRVAARARFRAQRPSTLAEWSAWARAMLADRAWSCELLPFTHQLHALEQPWAVAVARAVWVRHA